MPLFPALSFSQTIKNLPQTKEEAFKRYIDLVGGRWEAKGKW